MAVTSDPSIDGGYAIGEAIEATLTVSEAVTVAGMPTITLDIGSTERTAEHSGAGRVPSELRSRYTVAAGDEDTDGIAMVAKSPVLNGGTIRAGAAGATLTHGAVQTGNRNVNRAAPTVTPVTVQFSKDSYNVGEIDNPTTINIPENEVEIEVTLSEDPERTVIIPLTHTPQHGATTADYSGVPQNVTFNAGVTSQTFTFSVDDPTPEEGTGEKVQLSFGTTLPPGVTAGTPAETTVSILDNSATLVTIQFGAASYTVAESDNTVTPNVMENEVQIEVTLDKNPKRMVSIPIVTTNQDGATSADYSGVPPSITFDSGETSKTFTFAATDDTENDDGESVLLSFGSTLPYRVKPAPLAMAPNLTATVTITDDGVPQVKVYFQSSAYTVAEGETRIVEVRLSVDPERTVVIPIETANQGGATSADYSGVPSSVTFNSGERSKTFTFRAEADNEIDEGESVRLSFGTTLPPGVTEYTEGTPDSIIISITDTNIPHITVRFAQDAYTVTEHGTQTVTVTLSGDPERTVVIPIETENQGGATSADYSGVPPSVTFNSGETAKTFTFTAEDDDDNDDGESVLLGFGGTLPSGITAGMPATSLVSIIDGDVPQVTVQFGAVSYTVAEGDTEMVTVTLSADPERTVTIPMETMLQRGATSADYSDVPENVTFNSGDTSQTFNFAAEADSDNDDGESVLLGFSATLPPGVTKGTPATSLVSITDDDVPQLTVQFAAASYTVAEGNTQTVTVTLSGYPERMVVIPIETTHQNGATQADYFGVPQSVTFNAGDIFNLGDTEQTFTFTAEEDDENDDGESVRLSFSVNLPPGVTAGTQDETTVTITDDDDPTVTVMFGAPSYAVAEGSMQTVTITLSADPERTVVIPLTATNQGGTTAADYSGVPQSVTFNSGETAKTFTFAADDDNEDDDGESVRLSFGASLPADVTAGTPDSSIVSITDDDDPAVTVQFGAASYTVAEGGTQTVTVTLSADPERTIIIPIEKTDQGGADSADYSGVPSSVTFNAGEMSKPYTISATQDTVDDDNESVLLEFGTMPDAQVSAGAIGEATVSITDDDDPFVTVKFGQDSQGVGEGETVNVTIRLSADPERTVIIPIEATGQNGAGSGDYSVPASVTFNDGDTEKTIAFMATDDDDDESVKLSFGSSLPDRVSEGTRTETTLNIGDDDDPTVTVTFGQTAYTVAEGDTQTVTITLSADPERTVEIPIMATNQGSATSADYTVPASVTFNTGQMSQTITFTATDDTEDDDGESVRLSFGPMPDARVNPGTTNAATVSITDDDDPFVEVQFSQDSYTAPEGGTVSVSVTLSADPERTVVIPLVKIDQGSEEDDYSGVPSSVTFNATETVQSFTFTATDDSVSFAYRVWGC